METGAETGIGGGGGGGGGYSAASKATLFSSICQCGSCYCFYEMSVLSVIAHRHTECSVKCHVTIWADNFFKYIGTVF